MEFKAALFDFDGVIVHSTPTHLRGWEAAYHSLFNQDLDEACLRDIVGRSTAAIGRILAEKSGYAAAQSELVRRKQLYVFEHLGDIELIDGVEDFLARLETEKLPFGVVSNAPRDFIGATIAKHRLPIPFYFGLDDYHKPKPDAEPYVKGAIRLGFSFTSYKSIVVFEDSTHGLAAAIAAHMIPIGICSQHEPQTLFEAGAQQCFRNLRDAMKIFSNDF